MKTKAFAVVAILNLASQPSCLAADSPDRPVNIGTLTAANGLQTFITNNDYPSRAARERIEGSVDVLVLVDSHGSIVHSTVLNTVDPLLSDTVQRLAARRIRRLTAPGAQAGYFWARLPVVQFVIPECAGGTGDAAVASGAIKVTFECAHPMIDRPVD